MAALQICRSFSEDAGRYIPFDFPFLDVNVRLLSTLVLNLLYNPLQTAVHTVFYTFYLRGTSQLRGQLSIIQVQLDVVHSSIAAQAGHSSCLS